MGCIYKITNKITQKSYIGLTSGTAKKRFKKHLSMIYSNGCSALYSAFVKYGKDAFELETIVESDSMDELNELEVFYIKEFNALSPNGYNLTTGGKASLMSEESKNKISLAMKHRVIKWADKVSDGVKKRWQDEAYRDKQTKQRKNKRGKYKDGIVKPLRIDLPIDEINKMYADGMSINKIAKHFNVPHSTIKRRINYGA